MTINPTSVEIFGLKGTKEIAIKKAASYQISE